MRIRDSGSGFLGFGGGDKKGRSNSFKKGRRPGQKLRGTLLKKVTEDTAWVNIEGHTLLAQIRTNAQEGAPLSFLIKQLDPNIVLKAIFEPSRTGTAALNLANDFDTARTLFENQFRPHTIHLTKAEPVKRKLAFLELLQSDRSLLTTYLDAVACLALIAKATREEQSQLAYTPWTIPTARRHVSLIRQKKSLLEILQEFDLSNLGMVRVTFLARGDNASYKILLQHSGKAHALKRFLESRNQNPTLSLSIAQLPQRKHGGIITELMFPQK